MKTVALHDYVLQQMNQLLGTLASRARRASKKPGPKEIHDLRVSIRRFTQGLRLFVDFVPRWEDKKIRLMLRQMMRLTSDIRNRDIALEFLGKSGDARHRKRLEKERSQFERRFERMVRSWAARDFSAALRSRLALKAL